MTKGYPSQEKLDNTRQQFATVEPVGEKTHGLSVKATMTYTEVLTGTTASGSTTQDIVITGHSVREGDLLYFTSGGAIGSEAAVVEIIDANTVRLGQNLRAAPGVGDAFALLRPKALQVSSGGGISTGPLTFVRDGSDQVVTEDTGTPANNRPLPVKLTDLAGDVSINSANLNLEVQLEHTTANFDSVRIGDGTNLVGISDILKSMHVADRGYQSRWLYRRDYSSSNLTVASGYEEVIASTTGEASIIEIFDSSGETLLIGVGAAASEVDQFYVTPGGNGQVKLYVPAGVRVAIKAVSNDCTTGEITITAYGVY